MSSPYPAEERQDEALVREAQAGDRSAFARLVDRYRAHLLAAISLELRGPVAFRLDAEDVLHETFLRALEHIGRFRYGGERSFLRWLRGIARHVVLEGIRHLRHSPHALHHEEEIEDRPVDQTLRLRREERFERLKEALQSLSPDHRRVILLTRIKRLPLEAVARIMNRSPDAVGQLLWRALQNLRLAFGDTDSLHLPARSLDDSSSCGRERLP